MTLLKSVGMDNDGHFTISEPGDTLSTEVQADWGQTDTTQSNFINNKPSISGATGIYFASVLQSAPKMYSSSATVASGVAVFQLTANGLSTGTALFPTGPQTSTLNTFVNDATASYQMSAAWSNSNKTLTITCNKLTTANILTGLLGQAAANGAVVNVTVLGN